MSILSSDKSQKPNDLLNTNNKSIILGLTALCEVLRCGQNEDATTKSPISVISCIQSLLPVLDTLSVQEARQKLLTAVKTDEEAVTSKCHYE